MVANSSETSCERQRIQAAGHISAKPDPRQHGNHRASVIDELYQQGSARIRFPNTKPGALQAVLLNTAGGLTGDDCIHWQASAGKQSHLCVSTAACEKIYRTHGPASKQQTKLTVASQARLDWLPQESILFNGSHLDRSLHVDLEEHAEALIVESLIFGRQAMSEATDKIRVRDSWRIHRDRKLIHAEEFRLDMQFGVNAQRQCILHQYSALSTIVLITNQQHEWCKVKIAQIGKLSLGDDTQLRFGASVLPSRLIVRVMASNSFELRKFLIPCIELLNDGRPIPAVWNV